MGRARHCAICTTDPAITSQVNAQIEAGCKQKLIHEQNPQFSVSQISRHSRHLAPATADLTDAPASRGHALWLRRAEETFLRASADGDTKSAGQAISVVVRASTAMHKKQAEEAEAEKADVDDRYSIGAIDQSLRKSWRSGIVSVAGRREKCLLTGGGPRVFYARFCRLARSLDHPRAARNHSNLCFTKGDTECQRRLSGMLHSSLL